MTETRLCKDLALTYRGRYRSTRRRPGPSPGDTLHMWLLTLHPQILAELEALVQTGKLPKRRR